MKGFIEINAFASRILVATSAIVGVWDRGTEGCRISLNAPIAGFTDQGDRTLIDLAHSYDEIIGLIKAAE